VMLWMLYAAKKGRMTMSNYTVIVLSRHENVDCANRRFCTETDAEQALEIDLMWRKEIIAGVCEIRDGDICIRDEEPITFDRWCEEQQGVDNNE
jgi:hypothetical protein